MSLPGKFAKLLTAVLACAGLTSLPLFAALPASAAPANAALASAALASAAPVATTTPAIEVCGTGPAVQRPTSIVITCADHGMIAVDPHWTSWTATSATATVTLAWRVTPGRWSKTTADITLADPSREAGGKVLFTALRLHVTGATPRGFIRDATFNEAPLPAETLPAETLPARTLPAQIQAGAPAGAMAPARRAATKPRASGGSGQLNVAGIEGFWVLAGGQSTGSVTVPGYGAFTYPQIAAAITGAESSYEPGNIEPGESYADTGWGLWQITPGNSEPTYGVDYQLLDPWNNAEAAVAKYDANGFLPWTIYTSGAYEGFLPNVQGVLPDTVLTDPGQYQWFNGPAPAGSAANFALGGTYGPPIAGH